MKRSALVVPAVALALSAVPFAALAEGETPVSETPALTEPAPAAEDPDAGVVLASAVPDNPKGSTTDVAAGDEMAVNDGTVTTNEGKIATNNGTVQNNAAGAEIETNNGRVELSEGMVRTNGADGTVVDNNGDMGTNNGTIVNNNITIGGNYGVIINNKGNMIQNAEGAVVKINDSLVNGNMGTVEVNNDIVMTFGGTVEENNAGGYVGLRGGTVENNSGLVEARDGTVEINAGETRIYSDKTGVVKLNTAEGVVGFGVLDKTADLEALIEGRVEDNCGKIDFYEVRYDGLNYIRESDLDDYYGVQVKDADGAKTERYHESNKLGFKAGSTLGVLREMFANVRDGYELIGCTQNGQEVDLDAVYTVNGATLLWLNWKDLNPPKPEPKPVSQPQKISTRKVRPADLDALTGEAAEALKLLFRGELAEGNAVGVPGSFVLEVGASQGKRIAVRFLVPADRLPGVTLARLQKLSLQRVLRMLEPWIPQAYFRTVSLPNRKTAAQLGKYVSSVTAEQQGECFAFELVFDTGVVPA